MASSLRTGLCCIAVSAVPWAQAHAGCADIDPMRGINVQDDTIRIVASGSVDDIALGLGAGMWNGCDEAGPAMPTFKTSGAGDLTIDMVFHSGKCPEAGCGCGTWEPDIDGAVLEGGRIDIYAKTSSGQDCEPTLHETIAHELGHVVGLDDASGGGCSGRIMSGFQAGVHRSVQPADCAAAEGRWVTEEEFAGTGNDDHPCKQPPVGPSKETP